jgi:hypothetical protein
MNIMITKLEKLQFVKNVHTKEQVNIINLFIDMPNMV